MRDCLIFLESKKKMSQKKNQHPNSPTAKEVNHTSHWHQPSQSSSSNQPSYQHHNTRSNGITRDRYGLAAKPSAWGSHSPCGTLAAEVRELEASTVKAT
jgi:hypothetical protein